MDKEKEQAISNAIEAMINVPYDVTEAERAEKIQQQAAEIRARVRPEGRYSIEDAVILLIAETGDYYPLVKAVESGDIPCYKHEAGDKKGDPQDLRSYVCWDDLNKWIEEKTDIRKFRFPNPNAPAAKGKAGAGTTPAPVTRKNKLRRNNLDPAIDKAIKQAGNMELADVYLELKELAISGEKPFTSALEGDALCYTNDDNNLARLTKEALGKRLKSRR